jgi:hypothetical protein
MTPDDRQAHLDNERRQVREAAGWLLAGTPQGSNGKHTVATLAAEAGISRQRLYEHHADLVDEFKTTTGGAVSPDVQALQQQLDNSRERIHQLEGHITLLQERIRTLSATIPELTHEAQASNVVALPLRRPGTTSTSSTLTPPLPY